jgi:predicted O-linked N-acetylglucosamine transferase (SPINDLY family)/glycosyltransferase involved in cell wall biosynthesis
MNNIRYQDCNLHSPLVSICIPLFNKVKYIERTIKMALSQTYTNIEVIISDNGSTDGSEEIAKNYQSIDSRIKYYHLEHTIPAHANWEYAIRLAKGEFVHLLCADEWIEPNFVEEMIQPLLSNSDIDLTVCKISPLYEFDAPLEFVEYTDGFFHSINSYVQKIISLNNSPAKKSVIAALGTRYNFFGPMVSVIFRRSCCLTKYWKSPFGKIDCKSLHPDWDMLIRLHLNHQGYYLDSPLAKFSYNSTGFAVEVDSVPGYSLIDLIGRFLSPFVFLSDPSLSDLRVSLPTKDLAELKKITHIALDNIINEVSTIDNQSVNIVGNSLALSDEVQKRVHILVYTDDAGTYGVAQHSHAMMKGLIENGYRVSCVQGHDRHHLISERIDLGIQHFWLTTSDFAQTLTNDTEAKTLLQQIEPDMVVFSNCCPMSNFAAKRVTIELEIPYVVVEGSAGEYLADRFASYIPELTQHYQQARQTISVSVQNLETLRKRFGLSLNRGQVIYLGKPSEYFQPIDRSNRDRLRQELGIPDRAIVCFTAARFDEAKGYQYQIAVIEQLMHTPIWENIYFVWAGDGSFVPNVQQAIIDLGVRDRVKLLGLRSDIKVCLDMADIFILPSIIEGMPHSIMEAMAKGLPVIATKVGGIPEELGDTGKLLADPNINSQRMISELVETIKLWVLNPELRLQIGLACKQRASNMFTESRMIEETVEIIKTGLSIDSLQDNLDTDSELKNIIFQYHQAPIDSSIRNQLLNIRQELVNSYLNLDPIELKIAYQGSIGQRHRLLMGIDLPSLDLNHQIETAIGYGLNQPQSINYLLIGMLDRSAYQLPLKCDLTSIPNWLQFDYLEYLLTPPQIFTQIGATDRYYQYIQEWISYLHEQILLHPNDKFWNEVSELVAYRLNCISLYFNSHNLKDFYQKRAKIIESHLDNKGYNLDYEFPPRDSERNKIRIGILASHYTPQTETFTTLPFYKNLNRDIFEVVLYSLVDNNHRLSRYCAGHADAFIVLPDSLSDQVQTIRLDEIDILLIATNITAVTNSITRLATHRLARIQCVNNSSCVTTGMSNIDYYLSGKLTEIESNDQSHYTEKLLCIDGPAHCRDEGTESNLPASIVVNRAALGLTEQDIVYISGANLFKITPELELTWAKILKQQPGSKLVLYPFNPNWSNNYPINAFNQRIKYTFEQLGIQENRLIILDSVTNFADVKARLAVADVYLDSFPFSSINSLIDPLDVGLPVVIHDGNNFRSLMGAALMRSLNIPDLIADSEESYIQLAIELGKNPELRQQKRNEIESKMRNNPSFLDSRGYSAKIGDLFRKLFDNYNDERLNQNLRLSDVNLMVFPDWNQSEESVGLELQQVIQTLATQSGDRQTTLLIDTTNIAIEDAEMFISSVAMNLMMEADIDITEELEISLIEDLSDIQWETLMPKINARIVLECDNQASIGNLSLTELSQLDLESFMRSNQVLAAN